LWKTINIESAGKMSQTVVTRFAPSPTGYLHIGGARTALFSYLWARHTGGKFLLRIEDTDQKRNTPQATEQLIKDLKWLGLEWDNANDLVFQSKRLAIYEEYYKKLLAAGQAYYAFETQEELEAMRAAAEKAKTGFLYRAPQTLPTEADAQRARAQGRDVVLRFKMPNKAITVQDHVRGQVRFEPDQLGDFVIKKNDGYPTYHFAVVVDDYLMGVTHVLRGQEHLMNTPFHMALQEALGFTTPEYAHMSIVVSDSGGKMSKRERAKALRAGIEGATQLDSDELAAVGGISMEQLASFLKGDSTPEIEQIDAMADYLGVVLPEISVVDFLKSGYLPEALVNFIALLGFSPGENREIMSMKEMAQLFEVDKLTKTNSLFDRKKLVAFNTQYINSMAANEPGKLLSHFRDYLHLKESPMRTADDALLMRFLKVNAGARTLAEIERKCLFIFVPDEEIEFEQDAVNKVLLKNDGLAMLSIVRDKLAAIETITHENIEAMLRTLADEKKLGLGKVAQPLRVALCGNTISPPIFDSVDILGKERTLKRIDITLKKFGK
jgi:glutamyl-tRNA synthetase